MTKTPETEAGVVADLTRKASQAYTVQTADGRQFLIVPEGHSMADVTDPHGMVIPAPGRIAQGVTVQSVDSLVEYASRFRTDDTILFADIERNRIVAALDFHGPDKAAHVEHLATMDLPFSVEWKAWGDIDNKLMSQIAFARFIEENDADIAAPSGADLLEVIRDIHAVRTADFRQAVRTNTDAESFELTVDTETRSRSGNTKLELPKRFELRIPVYFGGETVTLFANLRFDIVENKLVLGVALHRAEHVRQAVFKQIVQDAAGRIDVPAVFGRIDAQPHRAAATGSRVATATGSTFASGSAG